MNTPKSQSEARSWKHKEKNRLVHNTLRDCHASEWQFLLNQQYSVSIRAEGLSDSQSDNRKLRIHIASGNLQFFICEE